MVSIDNARYRKVLGHELRQARPERGWTRDQLRSRMGGVLSLQTLAICETTGSGHGARGTGAPALRRPGATGRARITGSVVWCRCD